MRIGIEKTKTLGTIESRRKRKVRTEAFVLARSFSFRCGETLYEQLLPQELSHP